ncbi:MAG: CPBP family intramembrane metalloprotease [Ruminococcaceae bacterium]|nr:CPBP family intramembrane metalloprotease [Oscillospiraceae bacterium]
MTKLYEKSEIAFAISWIILYVVGTSITDSVVDTKLVTMLFHILLSAVVMVWIKNNRLLDKYGLCKPKERASKYFYYIPLIFICSTNLWFGVKLNMSVNETIFYVCSMVCVGFLEEIIFRGFLFKAMYKDDLKAAIIVSSVTFGVGHIVNLINGSGAELIPNLCQVCYAMAFGFMTVILFYKSGSLIPCIITHSVVNSLSAFVNESVRTFEINIIISVVLCVTSILYILILNKNLKKSEK